MAFRLSAETGTDDGKWLTTGDRRMMSSVSDSAICSLPMGSSSLTDLTEPQSTEHQADHVRSASASPNFSVRFRKKKNTRNNPSGIRPKSMGAIGRDETRLKTGATSHHRMSLADALKDKKVKVALRMFLQSEYSIENLDFWFEAEEYRKLRSPIERTKMAGQLYRTYIAMGAPNQINLDHYNRGHIASELGSDTAPSRDLFVGAQKYIFNIIENDSFARFVRSRHFEACQPSIRRSPRTILRNIFPSRRTYLKPPSQNEA